MLYSLLDLITEFKATNSHNPQDFGLFIRENYIPVYDEELEFLGYELD